MGMGSENSKEKFIDFRMWCFFRGRTLETLDTRSPKINEKFQYQKTIPFHAQNK